MQEVKKVYRHFERSEAGISKALVQKTVLLWAVVAFLFLGMALRSSGEVSAESNNWQASYWNNTTLSGEPVLERSESFLYYNWGKGSPAPSIVNVDGFSARWTRTLTLPSGTYRFDATADDGIRVYIDGTLLIDAWYNTELKTTSNLIYITPQPHEIVVEYYEAGGEALAQLKFDQILRGDDSNPPSAAPSTSWTGEYFANPNLRDAPVLVRQDETIDFNWGAAAPADGLPENGFSVRWTNSIDFAPGRYRFTITVDDGARLYLDDKILLNQWRSEPVRTISAEKTIYGGSTPIRLEYTEGNGNAQVSLTWTLLYPIGQQNVPTPPPPNLEPVDDQATISQRTPLRPTFNEAAAPIAFLEAGEVVTLAGTRSADSQWVRVINSNNLWGWVPVDVVQTDFPLETLTVWRQDW